MDSVAKCDGVRSGLGRRWTDHVGENDDDSTRAPARWQMTALRGVGRGVVFLLLAVAGYLVLHRLGIWYPDPLRDYEITALAAAVAIGVGKRLPLPLLLAVAVVVGWPWWQFFSYEVRVAPLAIAAYFAAAGGLRLRVAVPVIAVSATISQFVDLPQILNDPTDTPMFLSESQPSARVLLIAVVIAAALVGRSSWVQERNARMLTDRNDALERLAVSDRARIAAEERTAVAREVHDVVAHHVVAIVVRAQAAARVADSQPDQPRLAVEWIAGSGREALTAIRDVVRVLRGAETIGEPVEDGMSLTTALTELIDRIRSVGIAVQAEISVPSGLGAGQEFAVLRVCQEALTNVLIHSAARRVSVRIAASGPDAILTVEDDGSVSPEVSHGSHGDDLGSGGAGIRGMRERAEAAGGRLSAAPTGLGWKVELVVPCSGVIQPALADVLAAPRRTP